jgi:hypothetical protein
MVSPGATPATATPGREQPEGGCCNPLGLVFYALHRRLGKRVKAYGAFFNYAACKLSSAKFKGYAGGNKANYAAFFNYAACKLSSAKFKGATPFF